MEHLHETIDEQDRVRKTLARTGKDKDMWKRLFEDCIKKQGEETERLRQEYKEQSEPLEIAKTEQPLPAGSVPRRKSPMELLTPRKLNQTTEKQVTTRLGRVAIPKLHPEQSSRGKNFEAAGGTHGQQDSTRFLVDCTLRNN